LIAFFDDDFFNCVVVVSFCCLSVNANAFIGLWVDLTGLLKLLISKLLLVGWIDSFCNGVIERWLFVSSLIFLGVDKRFTNCCKCAANGLRSVIVVNVFVCCCCCCSFANASKVSAKARN
jgi:hypothetical protein